ncbi:MAG: DUF1302 domain-containing protein [Candidatus Tectomicrobia bacterium]|uniref:DUF1302 domain-containing protein n=1 Tax=Tectimicrobiota bacterium TaxID=2528274 RepID=A0A937W577_UNCTE|nr:DUF1302 domain-containing protein [Candidatus Tectomicrobia bacterium]
MTMRIACLGVLLSLCSSVPILAESLSEALSITGYVRHELAIRSSTPHEVTKAKTVVWLAGKYAVSPYLRLRLATRAFYDAVYDLTDTFPSHVARAQETEVSLQQALLELSSGPLDARLGLQHIVWGEAVGTFIADVVNPKDFREFVLPEFRDIRRPIWALNMTYALSEGLVLEGVWTPHLRFHKLPRPGAEFAFAPTPLPAGVEVVLTPTHIPTMTLAHSQGGVRLSWLTDGWDLALFYFDAFDYFPTPFTRSTRRPTTGQPVITVAPRHTRLHILGATLSKALEPVVLRSEIVTTFDKFLRTSHQRHSDQVVRQHVVNAMIGLDYTLLNTVLTGIQVLQYFVPGASAQVRDEQQRRGSVHTAFSIRLEAGLWDHTLVPQVLFIMNTDRGDYRLSSRLLYHATSALTVTLGTDIFSGPQHTLYGQFAQRDRVYTEVSYQF